MQNLSIEPTKNKHFEKSSQFLFAMANANIFLLVLQKTNNTTLTFSKQISNQ